MVFKNGVKIYKPRVIMVRVRQFSFEPKISMRHSAGAVLLNCFVKLLVSLNFLSVPHAGMSYIIADRMQPSLNKNYIWQTICTYPSRRSRPHTYCDVQQQNYYLKRDATQRHFASAFIDKGEPVQKKEEITISKNLPLSVFCTNLQTQTNVMTSSELMQAHITKK